VDRIGPRAFLTHDGMDLSLLRLLRLGQNATPGVDVDKPAAGTLFRQTASFTTTTTTTTTTANHNHNHNTTTTTTTAGEAPMSASLKLPSPSLSPPTYTHDSSIIQQATNNKQTDHHRQRCAQTISNSHIVSTAMKAFVPHKKYLLYCNKANHTKRERDAFHLKVVFPKYYKLSRVECTTILHAGFKMESSETTYWLKFQK
jgi:hypothetical protein